MNKTTLSTFHSKQSKEKRSYGYQYNTFHNVQSKEK